MCIRDRDKDLGSTAVVSRKRMAAQETNAVHDTWTPAVDRTSAACGLAQPPENGGSTSTCAETGRAGSREAMPSTRNVPFAITGSSAG